MEEMMKQELANTHMIQINACRMNLQLSFNSDMIRPNDKYIFHEFLRGERPIYLTSNHGWSKQDSPSTNAKKLWSKKIREIFQLKSLSLPIVYKLKEWIQPIQTRHTLHEWYYSEKNHVLFNRTADEIYR